MTTQLAMRISPAASRQRRGERRPRTAAASDVRSPKIEDLTDLLEQLGKVESKQGYVCLRDVVDAIGRRAFGPILVMPGLLVMSPAGGVPGMATAGGLVSLFVAVQLLFGRRSVWLPKWLLARRLKRHRYRRSLKAMRRPARAVDRVLRPRMQWAVQKPGLQLVALVAAVVALAMPLLEMLPFADTVPAAALTALGLALIAHDGAFALGAIALSLCSLGLVLFALL
jgi:hypothetical protein